jgi:hypothetical protein
MLKLSDLESALVGAHQAGDERAATALAQAIYAKRQSLGMNPDTGHYDAPNPADEGSPFLAGVGKGMTDVARGVAQLFPGGPSYADIAESRRLDAPLMDTTAGKVGSVVGNVAATAPLAFIPGGATLKGATAIGAGLGLAAPSASGGETLQNTFTGAAAGPAAVVAGRAVGAAYGAGKAVLEPIFKGGQERIAGRTLQAFAGGPQAAAKVIQDIEAGGAQALTPGVVRTLAESTDNAGISQLQRVMQNQPELIARFGELAKNNRAAVVEAIDSMTDQGKRAFFEEMRRQTGETMYAKAWSAGFNEKALAKYQPNIEALMQRPSVQAAIGKAKEIAAEEGQQLSDVGSMKGLHYVKKALDDMLGNASQTGIGKLQERAISGTREELLAVMDKVSKGGAYPKARAEYEALSRPINQIDVAQALKDKLLPALADFGDNTKLLANRYAEALRNGDKVAQKATGFDGATMANVMDPAQLEVIQNVARELANRTAATTRGMSAGSNTAQNLVSQNFLRQLAGPLGLPQGAVERAAGSTLGQTAMRPLQWAMQTGEPRIQGVLGEAMLNPTLAKQLMEKAAKESAPRALPSNTLAKLLFEQRGAATSYLPLASIGAAMDFTK